MRNRFFIITTYDDISARVLSTLLSFYPLLRLASTQPDILLKPCQRPSIDDFVNQHLTAIPPYEGNIGYAGAYELQDRIIRERTQHPIRKLNLTLQPTLRIQCLLSSWLQAFATAAEALAQIQKQLHQYEKEDHSLFRIYRFQRFHQQVLKYSEMYTYDRQDPLQQLFLYALSFVIMHDTADLPVPGKSIALEDILQSETHFQAFLGYIHPYPLPSPSETKPFHLALAEQRNFLHSLSKRMLEPWQAQLLDTCLHTVLHTVYHPHIEKPLAHFYSEAGYPDVKRNESEIGYSKLISIQLNSNRPAQLSHYFDNIEETADSPQEIEIIVNIDDDDRGMEQMLQQAMAQRPFTVKYVKSPRPRSFADLWQPLNKLIDVTDPGAYFMAIISDEMLFATKGWDTILKKYVGFFPDHLFRLRASRNMLRNYFDRWECSFVQNPVPITTKKWLDITGNWNPCFGPDSFQQLIAFYLAREGIFSNRNLLREVPLLDIKFQYEVPSVGLETAKVWKRTSDDVKSMEICQSYSMQLEACRRANLIKAHIFASAQSLTHFEVVDVPKKKQIHLLNAETNTVIYVLSYKLNRFKIFFFNQIRKLRFHSYFGGGKEANKFILLSFAGYLKAKYLGFEKLYQFLKKFKRKKHSQDTIR